MRIGMTTYGYLYSAPLEGALESIAHAGFKLVEIAPSPPHLVRTDEDRGSRLKLVRKLEQLQLTCISINPTELNLISTNPDLRDLALRLYAEAIALAHDLGAQMVVVVTGRQSQLIPMPVEMATRIVLEQLSRLVKEAHEHHVDLAIETVPFGFAESAAEVAALVHQIGDERVGIALDVANIFGKEDVSLAVSTAAPSLKMAHLSDTWRNRWAHTAIGSAEVDFAEFVEALERNGFRGPCIYELVDGSDPGLSIAADLERLKNLGLEA